MVIYAYNGILFDHEKNEILPFETTWMDFEDIMVSKMPYDLSNNNTDSHGHTG